MSREVELVIRAKNEATRAIDSIKDALKELTGVQEDVSKSASKTDSTLGELGNQLAQLTQQASKVASVGRIAEELDRSEAAARRAEAALVTTTDRLKNLTDESKKAEASVTSLTAKHADLTQKLIAEKAALDASKAAQTAANKELRDSERILNSLERRLGKAKKPSSDLIAQVEAQRAVVASTKTMQQQTASAHANQKASVESVTKAVRETAKEIRVAERHQAKLAQSIQRTSSDISKQERVLGVSNSRLKEVQTVAQQASAAMEGMAVTQDSVSKSASRMAAEMARVQAQMAATIKTPPSVRSDSDLSGDVRGNAERRAAIERLRELRKEMVGAQADATRLGAEFARSSSPTETLGRAAGEARGRLNRLKSEVLELTTRLRPASSSFIAFSQAATAMQRAGSTTSSSMSNLSATTTQVSAALRPIAPAASSAGTALTRSAGGANALRTALTGIYGETRKSLSLLQRLRGEVLSLTAGYLGLQAALRNIGGVVSAFQTLEAAQNRLGAVFNQDATRITQELQWLERQASRLGISFGVLSDEYGKFAIAASAANFTSEATREVFVSVAEAGRVNKLSMEQMSGVFLALTQMISKGKVQSEELRRQLGDRLSGAFNIFAEAIGVSTAELDEMMKNGEILANQSNLLKFADQLNKRFGPQLAEALRSTTTEMGRWQNSILQAQLRVAEGGFIEAFTGALRDLNDYFASREGREFFLSIGAALGNLINVVREVPKYFTEIKIAIGAIVAIKAGQFFSTLIGGITKTNNSLTATATSFFTWRGNMVALQGQMAAFGTALTPVKQAVNALRMQFVGVTAAGSIMGARFVVIQAGLAGLRTAAVLTAGAFRMLWAAIGGLPGLILTGVTIALGSWLTSVDETTSALSEHKRIMGEVLTAYEKVKGTTDDWRKSLQGASLIEIERNFRSIDKELTSVTKKLKVDILQALRGGVFDRMTFGFLKSEERVKLDEILKQFIKGKISVRELRETLKELNLEFQDDSIKKLIGDFDEGAASAQELEEALEQAAVAAVESGSQSQRLQEIAEKSGKTLEDFTGAVAEVPSALDAAREASKKFATGIDEIKGLIPELAGELKRLKDIAKLDELFGDALKNARTVQEIEKLVALTERARQGINLSAFGASGQGLTFEIIAKFEGFRENPYWDVNAYRVGYGSDTITLADGSIQKVVQGISVSQVDASRDLARRIGEFQETIKREIGSDRFGAMSPQQQAALTSIAYNYGNLSKTGELEVFRKGTVSEIADAIRRLGSHNGGVNRRRRNEEASLFESTGESYKLQQQQYEAETKRVEKIKEYNEAFDQRISDQQFEIQISKLSGREQAIQQALREENNKAIAAGTELSEAQRQKIIESTGALYDQKNAREGLTEAEKQVNDLYSLRQQLIEQIKFAEDQGEYDQVESLKFRIVEINEQLTVAIQNAIGMWQAIGGPEADAAIAKLQTTAASIANVTTKTNSLGLNIRQVETLVGGFADGLAGVFDTFTQAVANGENAFQALGKAFLQFAADFLRQIAVMIIRQMILNALTGFGGGIGSAALALGGVATAHSGGVVGSRFVGSGNASRSVSPAIFAYATRYHTGGIAGLAPDEVPTILRQGEEVLTEDDSRHRNNGGLNPQDGGGRTENIRNIITLDPDFAEQMMSSSVGERVIMSTLKKNQSTLKQLLG